MEGQPLVELFSVTLNGTDSEIYLYGTITVTDGLLCQYIYDRNRNNPEPIYAGDTILLNGPPRSISAVDSFTIDVDLADENKVSSNGEISYGQGSWNVYLTATNEYDKPLSMDIEGKNGSVTLSYIVFSNAVEATVQVTLIHADGKNTAEVFGLITARSDKVSNESMLFWKTSNENDLQVNLNGPIPLLRSAVAVPLDSSLIIRAELSNRERETNSNKEIAHDEIVFAPYLSARRSLQNNLAQVPPHSYPTASRSHPSVRQQPATRTTFFIATVTSGNTHTLDHSSRGIRSLSSESAGDVVVRSSVLFGSSVE
ncbi:uncharacterized protein LOC131151386 [Malania oleifera]|uniref:uncharacterized protein LOC131151386 n=1 Tax=Malania oleifera TaxID=397392 RepID=UPI0025AE6AAA|nr:uncharacterized protein LOC131151386 [Malania oleifera]